MEIRDFFKQHNKTAIAFSGGVDSAVLLALAKQYAKSVTAYYAASQFQPRFELEDAIQVAKALDVELKIIPLDILSDSTVTANPENRCYYCKKRIFTAICNEAKRDGYDVVLDGTNASDDAKDRPGMKALEELEIFSPLRLCGYTKADIRNIAKAHGLSVSSKPSYACLATRIPTGTAINSEILSLTEKAENALRKEGFENFRIRYINASAKIELGKEDFDLLFEKREKIYSLLSEYYDNIYLDLKERTYE